MDNEDRLRQEARNRCCLYVFVAFFTGFLVAMNLGAFSSAKDDEINDWVIAIFAGISAAISALAVYFVFRTLEATQKTLSATMEMVNHQKMIGDLQTRAWLLPLGLECEANGEVVFRFKNFGNTPCLDLCYEINKLDVGSFDLYSEIPENLQPTKHAGIIAPSNTYSISFGRLSARQIFQVKWVYMTVHGETVVDQIQYDLSPPKPGQISHGRRIRADMIGAYADPAMAAMYPSMDPHRK